MERSVLLRIGELSRRAGVSPELLRAWEKRYGLLEPSRTAGGLRLYTVEDEARVSRMRALLDSGLSAAEAARLAKGTANGASVTVTTAEYADELRSALSRFDDSSAQLALDRVFAAIGTDAALREVIVPFLHDLGNRWACDEATVGEEHFASNVIQGRLRALARGWDHGFGPRAVLACAPGELHEIGLLCFGLTLRARGWRITYMGADTPIQCIAAKLADEPPSITVVAAVTRERFEESLPILRRVARRHRMAIGGAGADVALARRIGAEYLGQDPVSAAVAVADSGAVAAGVG
jgi:DNA-binding transcriptional MerR regulator